MFARKWATLARRVEQHRERVSRDDLEDIDVCRPALEVVAHRHHESTDAVHVDRNSRVRHHQAIEVVEEKLRHGQGVERTSWRCSAVRLLRTFQYAAASGRFVRSHRLSASVMDDRPLKRVFPNQSAPLEVRFACAKRFRRWALGTLRKSRLAKVTTKPRRFCRSEAFTRGTSQSQSSSGNVATSHGKASTVRASRWSTCKALSRTAAGFRVARRERARCAKPDNPKTGQIDREPVTIHRTTLHRCQSRRRQTQLPHHHEPESIGRLAVSSFQESDVALRDTELAGGLGLSPPLLLTSGTKHFACHRTAHLAYYRTCNISAGGLRRLRSADATPCVRRRFRAVPLANRTLGSDRRHHEPARDHARPRRRQGLAQTDGWD